ADSALAQDISGLTAKVDDNAAAILNEQTARADADSALAQDIQTLAAQIDEAEAVVQQTSEALAELDGSVKANWQVKTQVRADGKVVQAGVGLGASIGADGQVRSEFLVMADTIGFLNTVNGEIHAPFVFDTVNDTAFLNSAIIGNASIGSAKFTDWLESDAKNQNDEPILRLNFRTGEIELNSATNNEGMSLRNNRIQVRNENGDVILTLGRLSV
ncbi:DUF1983 domain-containing protein, partial [Vibrio cincinnatiensis]|uniref:phage tail tip fiber protein n=1 Tax=Vibrio cincinnatiensis TaxID=675 RepID=UPI001EDE8408